MKNHEDPDNPVGTMSPGLSNCLAALDMVILQRVAGTQYEILSPPPRWLENVFPSLNPEASMVVNLLSLSIFLDNFLEEAEEHWDRGSEVVLKSGPWHEFDVREKEHYLEASAFLNRNQEILVLQSLGPDYDKRVQLFQKARDYVLQHQQLNREQQNNDILLHFLGHHLVEPVGELTKLLSELKGMNLGERADSVIKAAVQEAARQDILLDNLLRIFSTDVANMESFSRDDRNAPDILQCAKDVVRSQLNVFLQRSVGLNLENRIPPDVSSRVVGEQTRLVRIIENILSHSLRNSQEGTSISVRITSVNDWIRTEIHEVVPSIKRSGDDPFEALLTADRSGRKASLALYFCKLTVERWGGEVGYEPDPKSPHWWFNLPQANATSS